MENRPKDTLLRPFDDPTIADSAQTIGTPHFDEKSIQSARPAVPLVQIRARRFWRLALVLMFASTLAGGVIGIALSRYQNRAKQNSTPAANATSEGTSQHESVEPVSQPVANSPVSQPVADSEAKLNDAGSRDSEGNADPTRAVRPRENGVFGEQPISEAPDGNPRATLHHALDELIAATNARDIKRQMNFYDHTVNAFYLTRNVPRAAIRAEKSRVFQHADSIDIRAAEPGIRLSRDGRTATMRFRKKYAIEGGGEDRRGEVMHELRWRHTTDGWKIVSERDLRVIY